MTIEVGVFGGTGYTGLELVRLLVAHPDIDLRFVTSESSAGHSLRESSPQAPDIPLISSAAAEGQAVECVFLCLPHTQAAPVAAEALKRGARVIDLSADLRIDNAREYERWYGVPHPAPDLLPVPYGLPELGREHLIDAKAIANPGCYATAALLGLAPLVREELLVAGAPVIVDAKSGVTGAGRSPRLNLLFGEVHGDLSPYNIGRSHRHIAEIEQVLASGETGLLAPSAAHRPGYSGDDLRPGARQRGGLGRLPEDVRG
jgi:N-acetyl-gamma-glutamyl-phosphate reductase